MRKNIGRLCLVLVAALGLACLGGQAAFSSSPDGEGEIGQPWPGEGDFAPGQLLVKPRADVMAWQIDRDMGAQAVGTITPLGVGIVSLPIAQGVDSYQATLEMLARYQADPRVEWAELDYIVQAAGDPNDPRFSQQWALAKIQAPQAWDLTTGSPGVTIAVLDTGGDVTHGDLQSKLVPGYDIVNMDSDPSDDHGHGTHVAGIAAAATNNGQGVAGVGYDCTLMPIKVLASNGVGYHSWIAQGITYAADHGARVINMSLGGYTSSNTLRDAVDYAWSRGVLLVAAAGNDNTPIPSYPAAYEHVMGVSATDRYDHRASISNYGPHVSVAAPGLSILSTVRGGSYRREGGTSMASPHVAGLAGLVFAQDGSRTNATVRRIIESTADDLGSPDWDPYFGHGRINAYHALSSSGPWPTPTSAPAMPTVPAPTPQPEVSNFDRQVIDLINQKRADHGLAPLTVDERLMQAARRHSQDMANNDFFGHIGSDGSTPLSRMRDAGYDPIRAGEAIAAGSPSPLVIVDAWMGSGGHRAVLLGNFHDIGVGYAYNGDSTHHHYWTADFGTARNGGPTPTPRPSHTPTPTPRPTHTPTPRPTHTSTPRPSHTSTPRPSHTPTRMPTPTPYPSPTDAPTPTEQEYRMVELIKQERAHFDLPPLIIDERLMEAARRHSEDMANNSFFDHIGSDGSNPEDRMRAAGYPLSRGSEVLAAGSADPAAVLGAWMGSSAHRAILLDLGFSHIGAGYAHNDNTTFKHYWTVMVACPGTDPPTPTPPPGSDTIPLTPAADSVGWVMSAEASGNHFGDDDMYTGIFGGWIYHGAVQFDLSPIPSGAHIRSATLKLTGQTRNYVGDDGTWFLQLLSPDVDTNWSTHSFADIHNAPVLYTIPHTLRNGDLGVWVVNTFTFEGTHLQALEDRLATTRRVSFRLDGPESGDNNVFSWDSGHGTGGLGVDAAPTLQIAYSTP